MASHPDDPDVFANAAWGSLDDPAFSEEAYEKGLRLEPRAREWHLQMAEYYELQRGSSPQLAMRLAVKELHARLRAFHREDSPTAKLSALWNLRQCARVTGDAEVHRLLREADKVGSKAATAQTEASGLTNHLSHIAFGLVALAEGDDDSAVRELDAALSREFTGEADLTLANELLHKGRRGEVVQYLRRCAARAVPSRADWPDAILRIERGEDVDLGE
jgi:hypothetical protein